MEAMARALPLRAGASAHVDGVGIDGAALVQAVARHRDRHAFARLFAIFAPRIRGQLVARGAAPATADELTQEVMLTVWLKAAQFDPARGQLGTWLFAIARNCLISHIHRHRWPEPDPADQAQAANLPEDLLLSAERDQRLRDAVAALPPEQREILAGAYHRGRTLSQLADEKGIPLGTVKTRVRLALTRLRRSYPPGGTDDGK